MGFPLHGVNILDFTWVVTGPLATKLLANLGATVVKVEHPGSLDFVRDYPPFQGGMPGMNRSGLFATTNDGKYSMILNLNHPRAREVIETLVRWADVVVENFSAGVMERWHLAYEDLKEMKRDIIMIRASLLGQSGPYARQPGFGTMLQAYGGFISGMQWRGGTPAGSSSPWTDYSGAGFTAIAVLSALDYKMKRKKGVCIDLSQLEASQQFLIPSLLDYGANGRVTKPEGNRHAFACPHGAYPCRGEDRWCLIAVFTDEEWKGLKTAMGRPPWAEDPKFSTLLRRKQNEDALDRLIGSWTIHFEPGEIMRQLQKEGVPAGMVAEGEDLHTDPQLKDRQHYVTLEHPEMGATSYDAPPFRLSSTPHGLERPAPCIGQHTERICREFLQMSEEKFAELRAEGLFS